MEQHEVLIEKSYHDVVIKESLIQRYLSAKTPKARLKILLSLRDSMEQITLLSIAKARIDGKSFHQTERELKILKAKELHSKGYSYTQIARELKISKGTAYNYVHKY